MPNGSHWIDAGHGTSSVLIHAGETDVTTPAGIVDREALQNLPSVFHRGYVKMNPFSIDYLKLDPVGGSVSFGNEWEWIIPHGSDLAGGFNLVIDVALLSGGTTYQRFVNKVGLALWTEMTLNMSSEIVDRKRSKYADIANRLFSKKASLQQAEEIGDLPAAIRSERALRAQQFTIHFPMWANEGIQSMLKMDALGSAELKLKLATRALADITETDGTIAGGAVTSAKIYLLAVYVPSWELATHTLSQSVLVKTVKHFEDITLSTADQTKIIDLPFLEIQTDLLFVIQETAKVTAKDYFNYSMDRSAASSGNHTQGTAVDPPLLRVKSLTLNGQLRWDDIKEQFMRQYVSRLFHSNMPDGFIYSLPESISPEGYNPLGGMNYSNFAYPKIELEFQTSGASLYVAGKVHFYHVYYNFAAYGNGKVGIAYGAGL